MSNKILELTNKIYTEGVEKAKEEAAVIIAKAKKEADTIIVEAKKKEKEIISLSEKQIEENKKNSIAEIKLASHQLISKLKQQITELISTKQTETPIKEIFKEEAFIKDIILTIIKNWNVKQQEESSINLLLPAKQKQLFIDFFEQKAIKALNSELEINFTPNIKSGFKVAAKDGSYYISFTDKVFENYFKNYLKPKTKKLLFS